MDPYLDATPWDRHAREIHRLGREQRLIRVGIVVSLVALLIVSLALLSYASGAQVPSVCGSCGPSPSPPSNATPATSNLVASIYVGGAVSHLALDPSNGLVYGSVSDLFNVTLISGLKTVGSVTAGWEPDGVTYDSSNGDIYVTNDASDNVTIIHGTASAGTTGIGDGCSSISYDSVSQSLFAPCTWGNNITILGGTTNHVGSLAVPGAVPWGSCAAKGDVFVLGDDTSVVYVINGTTRSFVTNISLPAGSNPQDCAYDPSNGYLYTADMNSDAVSVIDVATNSIVTSIGVGSEPWGIAYAPTYGEITVSNSRSDSVSIINATTNVVKSTVTVGTGLAFPQGEVFDPMNGYLYVALSGNGTVAVLGHPPLTPVVIPQQTSNAQAKPSVVPYLIIGAVAGPAAGLSGVVLWKRGHRLPPPQPPLA